MQGTRFSFGRVGRLLERDSSCWKHEALEKERKVSVGVEREHIGDILVGSHNYHASPIPIDAAHVENVVLAFVVRAENFLVVTKPVPTFGG